MAGAAGSLALAGGRSGFAQASKRIEKLDPDIDAIIDTSQPIQELASGFGASSDPPKGRSGGKKAVTSCLAISTTTGA
jgi:hypothetical protein